MPADPRRVRDSGRARALGPRRSRSRSVGTGSPVQLDGGRGSGFVSTFDHVLLLGRHGMVRCKYLFGAVTGTVPTADLRGRRDRMRGAAGVLGRLHRLVRGSRSSRTCLAIVACGASSSCAGFAGGIERAERASSSRRSPSCSSVAAGDSRDHAAGGEPRASAFMFTPDVGQAGRLPTIWLEALTQNAWRHGGGVGADHRATRSTWPKVGRIRRSRPAFMLGVREQLRVAPGRDGMVLCTVFAMSTSAADAADQIAGRRATRGSPSSGCRSLFGRHAGRVGVLLVALLPRARVRGVEQSDRDDRRMASNACSPDAVHRPGGRAPPYRAHDRRRSRFVLGLPSAICDRGSSATRTGCGASR